ncbi:hypothetical protein EAI_11148, partial [Harpegnathos saltator]
ITASVMDAAMRFLGIATRSKTLKGTFVKVLRDASAIIAAGTTIMGKRIASDKGEDGEILEEVRLENQQLRTSQEELKKEMAQMKE